MLIQKLENRGKHSASVHNSIIANNTRMRKDIEYFNSKLSKIEGSGDLGNRLLELVDAKTVATQQPTETPSESKKDEGEAKTSEK